MRKIIFIASGIIVASGAIYFVSKPNISIEKADWLKKNIEYRVSAGFKSINGFKSLSDKQTTNVQLGMGYSMSVSSEGNKIIVSYKTMRGDLMGVIVDFSTQTISPVQKLIGS